MTRRREKQLIIISFILIVGIGVMAYFRKEKDTRIFTQDQIEAVEALTMEEKLGDFEYLHSFIEENYPLLKVNERINGVNWLGEKENFRKAIENASTDEIFMDEIGKIIKKLNDDMTNVVEDELFKNYYASYSNPKYEEDYKPWAEMVKDDKTLKRYRFDESQIKVLEEMNKSENMSTRPNLPDVPAFKSDIIELNEVAYIRINSMNIDRVEEDGKMIREFLKEVKDYKKLIIDVRSSNYFVGDEDSYWIRNIVEPLIDKEILVDNYLLTRGEYGKRFHEYRGMQLLPLAELTDEILNEELRTNYDYYSVQNLTISPVEPVGFDGKVYILIDNKVVYLAENFAGFCKDSGFATVVGETTSGLNFNFDNILFSLPNSGIVVNMRDIISLNNDGTIRQEVNIVPDIEVDAAIGTTYERDKAIQYIIED